MEVSTRKEPITLRTKKNKYRKVLLPWILLTPALVLLIFVISGPIVGTVVLSFTDWNGIRPPKFIGLENYKTLYTDAIFFKALINNFKWLLFFLTVPVLLGFVAALLISKIKKGQMIYRTLIFLPYIVSTVVTARIWQWIYNPYSGINIKLEEWGLDSLALLWLGDHRVALYAVALADSWHFMGFAMVLFLVGLQQMDRSLEEAAKVEGANSIRIFWHILLPQLRPTIVLVYMLLIIWSFAAFDYVFVMTGGGPANATELLATYMYKLAIYGHQPGYASAVAMSMGLLSVIVIVGFGYIKKKGWDV